MYFERTVSFSIRRPAGVACPVDLKKVSVQTASWSNFYLAATNYGSMEVFEKNGEETLERLRN